MAGNRIGKSLAGMLAALVAASAALAQSSPPDRALLETLHAAGQAFRSSLAEPNATIAAVDEARQKLEHEAGRLGGRGAGAQDQRIVDLYLAAARGYQEARNRFGADHSREHYLADVRQIETELAEADNLFQGAPPIVPAVAPAPPPPPPAPPRKRPQEHTVPVPPADLAPPPPVPPPMPPAHSPEPPTHATPPTSAPAKRPSQSTPPSAPTPSATATPAPPAAPTPPPPAANVAPPQAAAPPAAPPAPPKSAPAAEDQPKAATAPPTPQPAPIVVPPPSAPSTAAAPPAPVPESHAAPPPKPMVAEPPVVASPAPPAPVPPSHAAPPAAPAATAPAAAAPSPAPDPSAARHGPPIVSRAPVPTTPTAVRKAADKVRIEKNAGAVVDRCSLLGEVATGDVRSGAHEIGGHNFFYEDALGLARLMTVEAGGDTLLLRERSKTRVTGDAYRCSPAP